LTIAGNPFCKNVEIPQVCEIDILSMFFFDFIFFASDCVYESIIVPLSHDIIFNSGYHFPISQREDFRWAPTQSKPQETVSLERKEERAAEIFERKEDQFQKTKR
jgi:hypothetical protein